MYTNSFIGHIKQKTFTQTLQNMLKQDFILQTTKSIDYYPQEKLKKMIALKKDKSVEKAIVKKI